MEPLQAKGLRARLADEIYTYCAFCIAITSLPALAFSYFVVRVSKYLWLRLLSSRYPKLEFIATDTVRSLLDTHRNQGIINVLLCVKGTLNGDTIKQNLTQHLIERRDKNGDYMFPRLRHLLVSCWGNYAWDIHHAFKLENHVIVGNAVHRGRPLNDNNIQDYVSEIISKYFPSDQPPWQYVIIPYASAEPKFYILVRVHHLLLTGKNSLNIGDLLLVEQKRTSVMMSNASEFEVQSPLLKLFPTPSAIPELCDKLNEMLANAWNEFVSEYDPVESTRALKSLPGAFHVGSLVLLSTVNAMRELAKKHYNGRSTMAESPLTVTNLLAAIQRECKRRNLTIPKAVLSPLVTIDPRKWPRVFISSMFTITRAVIKLPVSIRDELMAIRELKKTGQVLYPHTLTWKYGGLVQLAGRALEEAWDGMKKAYRAPIKLWSVVIRSHTDQKHVLQTVSLCGRKVAAWSKPVSRAGIERTARVLGVTATDISLYAATEALRAYFEQTNNQQPEVVLTTARAATEDFLFTFAEGVGKKYQKTQTGGMVCLALPIGATPRRMAAVVEQACNRQGALVAAWIAQARYGALTRALPSPLARLTLNLLSRRYAVSYAEVDSPESATERKMIWGQQLDSVLYWRPPQANISMSLTVIQYADSVRLCVMSDSRLVPGHSIPCVRWSTAIEHLVNKVDQEVARISQSRHTIPRIIETISQEVQEEQESTSNAETSTGSLKPPTAELISPPLPRKRIKN